MSDLSNLEAVVEPFGQVSVWLGGVTGDPWFTYRAEVEHYACSTIKVALVLAAYREADAGRLDLDRTVRIHDEFDSRVAGYRFTMSRTDDDDSALWQRLGEDVAMRWLACRAIVRSSNLATNLLLDAVGLGTVADTLRACGSKRTAMTRGIDDLAARDAGATNVVTARDLAVIFQSIASANLGSNGVASPASLHELRGFLGAQQLNDGIPAGLPPGVPVEHKTGSIEGVSHDAGIVHPRDGRSYVLAVCTTTGLPDADASRLIADISAAAWHARR